MAQACAIHVRGDLAKRATCHNGGKSPLLPNKRHATPACAEIKKFVASPLFGRNSFQDVAGDDQTLPGYTRIPNIDIDNDGAFDSVYVDFIRTDSRMPADPSRVVARLASGAKVEFEDIGLRPVMYRGQTLLVAADTPYPDPRGLEPGTRRVYRIGSKGNVTLICRNI